MKARFWFILCVLSLGCTAETFSPSATYTIEVTSGAIPVGVAPGEAIQPLILRVLDDRGRPVVGHPVSVEVNEGDGTAQLNATQSGPEGLVALSWSAGPLPGPQRVSVTPLGGETARFTTEVTGFQAARLSVGHFNACAIDLDQRAWCWGDGLSDGAARGDSGIDTLPDWRPIPVTGGHRFQEIAAGGDVTCGLDLDGYAWCWGRDHLGQLGQGAAVAPTSCWSLPCVRYPVPVVGGHTFTQIVSTVSTVCALDADKAVWCWGDNSGGEVGMGTMSPQPIRTPVRALVSDSTAELFAGYGYFCAHGNSGIVECWGYRRSGTGSNPNYGTPTEIVTAERFPKLFAAPDGMCGRNASGETYCWGSIGGVIGPVTRRTELDRFVVLGGDWLSTGWGLDATGHLNRFYQNSSAEVSGNIRLTSISSGGESGCGLGGGGQVWCWGSNSEGELGNGSVSDAFDYWHYPPTPVGGWHPLP